MTTTSWASGTWIQTITLAFLFIIIIKLSQGLYQHLNRKRRRERFFQGKHVWLTGASMGIGASLARLLVSSGARVTLSSRNHSLLTQLSNVIATDESSNSSDKVGSSLVVPLDLLQGHSAVEAAYTIATQTYGPIDVLIANAGVNHGEREFVELDAEDVVNVVRVNLEGLIHCVRVVLPGMIRMKEEGGVVCGVSSLAAVRGVPRSSVYSATKAGVSTFLEAIRVELRDSSVRVVCVQPGFVDTTAIADMTHPRPFMCSSDHAAQEILDAIVRGDPVYGFPWVMQEVVCRFQAWLGPYVLYDFVMSKLSQLERKSSKKD